LTLVAFEYLWYQAWVQSIDQAKAGLQATLIIRHPDDGKLYVNFDQEILQLIHHAGPTRLCRLRGTSTHQIRTSYRQPLSSLRKQAYLSQQVHSLTHSL
jgi:hypothetical protein